MSRVELLRPIVQRLTSTPVAQLPQNAYFLASSLSSWFRQKQTGEDNDVLLHKLKTRISSLLQDRSAEGRFTAIVLIKALIEAGQREILITAEPWARGLLATLSKPDPIATKKLCIITLTRLFILTQQYPSLVREITVPLLPSFITACLNAIKPRQSATEEGKSVVPSPLLHVVLRSWSELLPQHPSVFRPFVSRFRPICLSIVGDEQASEQVVDAATELLVALHYCAPKNSCSAEWTQLIVTTIQSAHTTANQVFRAVIEDWKSTDPSFLHDTAKKDFRKEPGTKGIDQLGLHEWIGLYAGSRRLMSLFKILQSAFSSSSAQPATLSFGHVLDLLTRVHSVVVPRSTKDTSIRLNAEASRDEREELFLQLPKIHMESLRTITTILNTFSDLVLPEFRVILDHMVWIFGAEQYHSDVRAAIYRVLEALLPCAGPSMGVEDTKRLAPIFHMCCSDLVIPVKGDERETQNSSKSRTKSNGINTADVDLFLKSPKERKQEKLLEPTNQTIYEVAYSLLPILIQNLPARNVPTAIRTQFDRTAILTQNKEAMMVSVLNPPVSSQGLKTTASILPFLAQTCKDDPRLEALLRPRMPVMLNATAHENGIEDDPIGEQDPSDLLETLENSLNPQNDFNPSITESSHQPQRLNQADNPQQAESSNQNSSTKRDFATMTTNTEEASTESSSRVQQPSPIAKRMRVDGEDAFQQAFLGASDAAKVFLGASVPHTTEAGQIGDADKAPLDNNTPQVDPTQSEKAPITQKVPRQMQRNDDDGGEESDESELPEINVELDTEEEEEGEEEEGL